MPRILFAGGGTLGSVMPLLAVAEKIKEKQDNSEFFWLGTRQGPEKIVVQAANIKFYKIFSGKLRRYFDWRNFVDPLKLIIGFIQSCHLIKKLRPDIIVGAGGFVQVPIMLVGRIRKIPIFLHQQDVKPSLSNLLLSRFAKIITTSFDESVKYFPKNKTQAVGNPARIKMLVGDKEVARKMFHLEDGIPTLLVLGGGTGAVRLNRLIWEALPLIEDKVQIIHSVGKRKLETNRADSIRYHHYEFLGEELGHAYASADLVLCRAGMGTLTEVSASGTPSILVPISGTHQVDNARYYEKHGASLYFDENRGSEELSKVILEILENHVMRKKLGQNMRILYKESASGVMADLILGLLPK